MIKSLSILIAFLFGTVVVSAQSSVLDRSRLNTAAFYSYAKSGDVTIQVHVWGAVRYPGLYEIPRGTKLSELISLSGGPMLGQRSRRSKQTLDMKLHRMAGTTRSVIFHTTMENQIVVRNDDPVLQGEDVLSVEVVAKQGISWRDIFPIVSMAATLVLLLGRVGAK